ncbi:MAG: MotA/TolQ/ExbB proton channel family protein [Gammaproteobacteria bacterium]
MPKALKPALALLFSALGVHLVYLFFIRPHAELAMLAAQGKPVARVFSVILKDYEQEICIILMFWGIYLMLEKCYAISKHRYLFTMKLLGGGGGEEHAGGGVTMREMQSALREFEKIEDQETRDAPLIKTLRIAARRYIATQSVQDTSDAIVTGVEALAARIESENSMIRYLIWAIPSIGFIGTVRGIGQALAQADRALAGDIAGMTNSLGVAFNSTFVALIISILLMFLLHELQRLQDQLVVDTQSYCEEFLLNRIGK